MEVRRRRRKHEQDIFDYLVEKTDTSTSDLARYDFVADLVTDVVYLISSNEANFLHEMTYFIEVLKNKVIASRRDFKLEM